MFVNGRRVSLCAAAFAACCVGASSAAQVAPERDLVAELRAAMPAAGSVIAVYKSEGLQETTIGYSFRTGAWFHWIHFGQRGSVPDTFSGKDPAGRYFGGQATPGDGKYHEPGGLEPAAVLDAFFPTLLVLNLAKEFGAQWGQIDDQRSGWIIRAKLVRGSRTQPLSAMTPKMIEALGGADRLVQDVELRIAEDLTLVSVRRGSGRAEVLESADCSRPGFQVLTRPMFPPTSLVLDRCEWHADEVQAFTLEAIEGAAVRKRLSVPWRRTPVTDPDPNAPRPTPLQGDGGDWTASSASRTLIWAGALVTVLALIAAIWIRRRNAT